MGNLLGHFKTITKHRHAVLRHCFKAGIPWQGLTHDLSKYSPAEFIPGVKYYTGTKSPNEGERRDKGFSAAWMHHKGRNRHHFEYWTDYDYKTHLMTTMEMPARYIVEMFCDRVAASKIYQGVNYTPAHPLHYFQTGYANKALNPKTARRLESLLVMLAERGETETFAYIRRSWRHWDPENGDLPVIPQTSAEEQS